MPVSIRPDRRFPVWPLVVLLALQAPSPAVAVSEYQGEVVRVLDGNTIEVLHNQHPTRVRLTGIDCPEKGQAFGNRAKQTASALDFGKDVILQTHDQDQYGRTIGDVILPDGMNLNQELVKAGWCWWYRKYAPQGVSIFEDAGRACSRRASD